jgi:hypothetical protein
MSDNERAEHERGTAYHEAAHAVAGLRRSCGLEYTTMDAGTDRGPRCKWNPALEGTVGVEVIVAAEVVDFRLRDRIGSHVATIPDMSSDDYMALNLALGVSDGDLDRAHELVMKARDRMADEVATPKFWREIEAVAAELLARRTLTGAEVRAIVEKVA